MYENQQCPAGIAVYHKYSYNAGEREAIAIIDQLAGEPRMHRCYAAFYAYEFFVARKPEG